ncbi:hypothetical protein SGQ83_21775 [Flavobacterium sp. Fl-318]|uniref:AbiEi antitoxin C-terminal domain-containing protein n=1 Tax=Flavobacterium cupriresistens TaxID=2893885 RepID=A0ABU4RHG7_9FLAO|nr:MULTISPECIES: hypothetical protein [unclassified Flavobacterium]MDX6191989.1 hypothetical protein [Flavobacterium sp. Fl-318]UFH44647.1 hypothetical protein LNP23_10700 [Flavobacterium sp. F-323]
MDQFKKNSPWLFFQYSIIKVTNKIINKINQINKGDLFGYEIFELSSSEAIAGYKVLSRLSGKGIIKRAKKGYYYKPIFSAFGEQKPKENLLLDLYLFKKEEQVAYVTGIRLYNRLGLIPDTPSFIHIASLDKQIKGKIGSVTLKPSKSYVQVSSNAIKYLELLDVIKDLNIIPGLQKKEALGYLKKEFHNFTTVEIKNLINYGLSYPPKVRALLGALLEEIQIDSQLYTDLRKSIKSSSNSFQCGINKELLSTANSWKIA